MSDSVYGASIGGGGSPLQTPLLGQTVNPAGALLDWNKARASQFAPAQAEAQVGLTKAQASEAQAHGAAMGVGAQLQQFSLGMLQQQYGRLYGGNDPTSISGSAGTPWEEPTGNSGGGGGGNSGYAGTPGSPTGASLVQTQQPTSTPNAPAAAPAPAPAPAIGSGKEVGPPAAPTGEASATPGIGVFATESQPVNPNEVQQTPLPAPGEQPARQGTPNRGVLSGQGAPNGQPAANVTGAGGTIDPLIGFATPKGWALGFWQAQDKAGERERLYNLRQQTIGQAVGSAIDPRTGAVNPQLWNQATRGLFDQGFITLQQARDYYNRPDLAGNVLNGLLKPSEQPTIQAAAEGQKQMATVVPEAMKAANRARIEGDNTLVTVDVPSADGTSSVQTQMTRNDAIRRGVLKADGSNGTGSVSQGQTGPNTPMSGGAFATRVTGQENGTGNPAARNQSGPGGTATSSAVGNAQFLKDTWLDEMKRNAPQLTQGKTDDQILAMRADPAISAQMTEAYGRENSVALGNAGVPVNATTLGMAHGFGPDGARKLLNAPADASASSVLGQKVMDANPNLRGKTVADVVGGYKNRWGLGPVSFDQPGQTGGGTQVAGPGAGPSGNDVMAGTTPPNAGTVAPQPGEVGRTTPTPSATTGKLIDNDLGQMNKDTEAVADMQGGAQHSAAAQAILYDLRERLKRAPGTTGALGDLRTETANYLKTFAPAWANTFIDKTTGFDPNKAGDMQTIIKEALTATTGAETTLLPGARYGAMLTNYFSKAMPSINTQGPAFKEMMNWQLIGHQMVKDHAAFMQDDNAADRASFQGDMVHNRYATLNASQQRWMSPDGVHIPEVYQAASDAINHRPYNQWSHGLNAAQLGEVGQIIKRVDPTQGGLMNSHGDWIPISRVPAQGW